MCFAPQRRALFRHRNFQKWSDAEVFCAFWLGKCFAPQRRALFRHLNFQKWSGAGVILCILTSKCASPHSSVHFFDIWTSKSGPRMVSFVLFWLRNVLRATTACNFSSLIWPARTRRFSEPTFRPSGATNLGKHSVSRLSYLFAHLDLFSETFSFWSSFFFSSLLWLCPSLLFICPCCREFDFKTSFDHLLFEKGFESPSLNQKS